MTAKHAPTKEDREKVKSYTAVGITQEDISKVLQIDLKTLRKYYREELDTAAVMANAAIGGALFRKAKGGDTASMIWWTKSRMGWKEDRSDEAGKQSTADALLELAKRLPT